MLLNTQRNSLLNRWEERWENLQLSKYFSIQILTVTMCTVFYYN